MQFCATREASREWGSRPKHLVQVIHLAERRTAFGNLAAVALLVLLVGLCGCATSRPRVYPVLAEPSISPELVAKAQRMLADLYPAAYRATQRAIVTMGRKQYVCDGVLRASPDEGLRLAVLSALGLVTDVQVRPDQPNVVLRTTPLFRADWSRNFIARDLRILFLAPQDAQLAGRLADGRLVLESRATAVAPAARFILSPDAQRLQEVEVVNEGSRVYHATVRHYRKFAGFAQEIPTEIEVVTPSYRLNLRTATLTPLTAAAGSVTP